MTHDTNEPTSPNPYDDADPIPASPRAARFARSDNRQGSSRTRSRSVQSARDSAQLSQQRIDRMGDDAARIRPARPTSSRASSASSARRTARNPQPVQQPSRQARGNQTHSRSRGGYTPIATTSDRRRQGWQSGPSSMRRRRKMGFGIIAGIILAAIAALGTLLWWINRPVPVTVNGEAAEVRVSSRLEEVMREQGITVNPGDYVSVSDRVLQQGSGNAFTAQVNGRTLTQAEVEDYRIAGNEAIEFTDGGNVCEEYEATTESVMPYLRMEGTGYSLQYISQWGYPGERETRTGKESGEVADVITKEPQDCVVTCVDPYIDGDTKYAALTFDDGPLSPYTEQYLDILSSHGVHATFFNLGENVEANPALARRIVEEGNEIANHTMAHNQLTAVSADTIYNEITTSANVIENATGVKSSHIRPPYGDFSAESWLASKGSITASIRWTADSLDWKLPGAEAIVTNSTANSYSGMIILMHDGGGDRSQDVEALPSIIEQLQAQGYQFVTIADLMRAMGNIPEEVCSGSGTMPADAVWPEELAPDANS